MNPRHLLDPTNDVAFRKVFANRTQTAPLRGLLNAVLDRKGPEAIVTIQVLDPSELPVTLEGKSSIVDVKATSQSGEIFVVQMQVDGGAFWALRSIFDICTAFSNQLEPKDDNYKDLSPVVFVGICNFMVDWMAVDKTVASTEELKASRAARFQRLKDSEWHQHVALCNLKTKTMVSEYLQLHFLELPAFKLEKHQLTTPLEKWMWYFKHATEITELPSECEEEPGLPEAYSALTMMHWTEVEIRRYDLVKYHRFDQRDHMESTLADRESEIREEFEAVVDAALQEKATALQEKDTALQEKDTALQEKDAALAALQEKDAELQKKDAELQQIVSTLRSLGLSEADIAKVVAQK